ncbi:MAG: ROK family protein [Elusimicrobiota bacterium]|jgi:glucokinase
MPKKLTLGIDLGGTGIKLGLITHTGEIINSFRFSTPSKRDAKEVINQIAGHARELIGTAGNAKISGIGIGAAGDVAPETGVVRISPNLGWHNVPLKALLSRRLKYPIVVENDANAAAWAAYVVQARRKIRHLLCVTVGTGIGGGIVLNGKLYRGATGTAGEIGHMTLFPEGHPCNCGNRGCLERYIGVKAMVQEAKQAIASGKTSLITKLCEGDHSKIDPLLIEQAASQGDALAIHIWEQAGERLGIALASLVNILNPEWIVLAGGLSRAGNLLLTPLKRTIKKRSFPVPASTVRIVISDLDQDLGIVGAGLVAHEMSA